MRLSIINGVGRHSVIRRFRFAVVDLDKAKDYPLNFVCMLPKQVTPKGSGASVFANVFGNESLTVANELLLEALETETDSEVKAEIEKRLKLLEAKTVSQMKCLACGKFFQPMRVTRVKQKYCLECVTKKFGRRA